MGNTTGGDSAQHQAELADDNSDDGYPHPPSLASAFPAPALFQAPPVPWPVVPPNSRRGVLDARGIERGACTRCPHCTVYNPRSHDGAGGPANWRCLDCNCVPVVHEKISSAVQAWGAWGASDSVTQTAADELQTQSPAADGSTVFVPTLDQRWQCGYPGCRDRVKFDANTGLQEAYCSIHINGGMAQPLLYAGEPDLEVEDVEPVDFQPCTWAPAAGSYPVYVQQPPPFQQDEPTAVPDQTSACQGLRTCAIAECPNPCFVDGSGKVHDCCGYTHAMEHQRRLAIQQQNQVIKGTTHCLLAECSRLVWPFKNYCGKTHADIGRQRGLVPPAPAAPQAGAEKDKDSSLCILPGCHKPKYVEGGSTYDFCGRYHAQLGKQQGVSSTAEKEEDQCELPGCQKPKRKEGTRVHDYCCRDHASQDAPNRDARILTSVQDVKRFLSKYQSTLTVVDMEENDAAKPGGELYRRYKAKWQSLPQDQRKSCLAFHGTADSNIHSICTNGYDTSKRGAHGQVHGAGEYFAKSPGISLGYCGGKKIILNELLLGQSGTHYTESGDIIVMKDPAHDLPRFVITFK